MFRTYRCLITIVICCTACSSVKKSAVKNQMVLEDSYCAPPKYFSVFRKNFSYNSDSILLIDKPLQKYFSKQDILLMNALDIDSDMNNSVNAIATKDNTIQSLKADAKINNRISWALSEINACAAEFDCEGERADQVAKYLDDINSSRNTRFTAASVIVGAASAIAAAFIVKNSVNKIVAVAAGGLGAGLSIATLGPKGKKIRFSHKRNLLRDIWTGQENATNDFSPFIWYMLNEKSFSNNGEYALSRNLKNRWIEYQFNGNEKDGARSVLFTDGGIYTADDLHARAAMINQTQATVRSLSQNIAYFMTDYYKWKSAQY